MSGLSRDIKRYRGLIKTGMPRELRDMLGQVSIDFGVSVKGVKETCETIANTFPAALARNRRIFLDKTADRIILDVRQGNWFTHDSGKLKRALTKSRPRMTKFTGEIDVLWGGESAVYGPVLEHGPKVPRWVIVPSGTTAKGTAVKALRWTVSGGGLGTVGVRYARKVVHIDKPSHRRPHISKVVERLGPWIEAEQVNAIRDAKIAVGLS